MDRHSFHNKTGTATHPNGLRLESMLELKIKKRQQTWCRPCMSSRCIHDTKHQTQPSDQQSNADSSDELKFSLNQIKSKRQQTDTLNDQLELFNTQCRLQILKQPHLPTQWCIPPWLVEALQHPITFPLVPVFPTVQEDLDKISRYVPLITTSLPREYEHAGRFMRRLILQPCEIRAQKKKPCLNISTMPPLCVVEEISYGAVVDGTEREDATGDTGCSNLVTKTGLLDNADGLQLEGSSSDSSLSLLNIVGSCLKWSNMLSCRTATIERCRDERVEISGAFSVRDEDNIKSSSSGGHEIPFALVMFPGHSGRGGHRTQVFGMYRRRSSIVGSQLFLRWKYEIRL